MITVTSLQKTYGHKKAVSDISFTAKEGEIIGFLGPNGAGKTTTMRLLLGYLSPTKGTVKVFNHDPRQHRIEIVKRTGYLPENNPLYTEMKVKEYLGFVAMVRGLPFDAEVAEQVGIEDVLDKKIDELSRGYKQRVGLAAALLSDPDLLILDEPTSGLDPIEQDRIKDLIKKLSKKKTVIFSTHILSEVEDIATRLIIIDKGSIVFDDKKPSGKGAVEKLFRKVVKK
ncbi:MAG: ABC transporter ATP-binding protein [Patescibacteria group bacterium]